MINEVGSSITALMEEYNTIAHNMANINTAGYKRRVNSFSQELMEQIWGEEASPDAGAITIESALDFSQGAMLVTDRPLDVAISGKGFLVIETPDGELYSRNGALQISQQGQLVDLNGRIVAGQGGPIVVPQGVSIQEVNIAQDGNVTANGAILGKLKVVDFGQDDNQLVTVGDNCLQAPEGVTPQAATGALLRQGYREKSNVQLIEELVSLVSVSRLYETNMKILGREMENAKVMIGVANS